MVFGLKVSKAQEEEKIDPTCYRRNVGCLQYLLHTWPDLALSVGVASRYMQSPRNSHGEKMKHILQYFKGMIAFGLKFNRGWSKKIIGFSDNSQNNDHEWWNKHYRSYILPWILTDYLVFTKIEHVGSFVMWGWVHGSNRDSETSHFASRYIKQDQMMEDRTNHYKDR